MTLAPFECLASIGPALSIFVSVACGLNGDVTPMTSQCPRDGRHVTPQHHVALTSRDSTMSCDIMMPRDTMASCNADLT